VAETVEGDLGAVLAGGRFTVTGFCVFNPARPFDPAPAVPGARPAPGALVAVEDVGGSPDGVTFSL
jgi:hypothetical protein